MLYTDRRLSPRSTATCTNIACSLANPAGFAFVGWTRTATQDATVASDDGSAWRRSYLRARARALATRLGQPVGRATSFASPTLSTSTCTPRIATYHLNRTSDHVRSRRPHYVAARTPQAPAVPPGPRPPHTLQRSAVHSTPGVRTLTCLVARPEAGRVFTRKRGWLMYVRKARES